MKKSIKILTTLFFVLLFCLPVLAEGYSVLVLPNSCVVSDQKHVVGNVDIEELLARKFIDKFEATGNDYAPTLRVLQISIKNNPDFNKNAVDRMENAKILSASYGVPKVLLVSSRIENKIDRKKYQNRTDLPILTQQNTNTRIITKLTMYNTKTNEVLWSDVYYKNIDALACTNIGIINAYYDELIPKALANIRATKETHAVIVGNNRTNISQTKTVTNTAPVKTTPAKTAITQNTTSKELKPIKQEPVKSNPALVEKKNLTTPVANITPDLRMKDEVNKKPVSSPKKPSKLAQAKANLQTKYNNYKHEKEMAELEKASKPTPAKSVATKQEKTQPVVKQKEVKTEPKKVAEQKTVQTNEAKTKSSKHVIQGNEEEKTLAQWLKERHQQENKTELKQEPKTAKIQPAKTEPKKEIVKKEQPKETKTVAKKQETIKPTPKQKVETVAKQKEVKSEKTVTKPEPRKVAQQKKVVKEQPKKEIKTATKKDKEKFSAKIKSKCANLKAKYDEHKTQKIRTSEENVKYSTVILKNDESTSSANRYINTRPRYNSVNYIPEFDTSVNDI